MNEALFRKDSSPDECHDRQMTVTLSRPRVSPLRMFPAYAYLPGGFPHPVRDPLGHSHGLSIVA